MFDKCDIIYIYSFMVTLNASLLSRLTTEDMLNALHRSFFCGGTRISGRQYLKIVFKNP